MPPFTKNRARLLKLFLQKPSQSFYMHEIGRMLGKKPGIFQRTLNNMVSEGIITSVHKTHVRYFKINTKYQLYKELKSIIAKTT